MKKLTILFFAFLLCCSMASAQQFLPFSPVGEIKMYGGLTAPSGFLLCDGSLASTTTYPALSAVIRAQYIQPGDPADSFRLPNLQGVFPKGFGSQSIGGVTYANASGTPQADKMQGHFHPVTNNAGHYATAGAPDGSGGSSAVGQTTYVSTVYVARGAITDGTSGTPRTGTITEPANVGVSFIIKY